MNPQTRDEWLDLLIAKDQIRDLALTLARAMDRNDSEQILACYWPGSPEHHGLGFDGAVEDFVGFINDLNTAHTMFHQITNHYVEVDGDRARGEIYIQAILRTRGGDPVEFIPTGRYLDRYERRGGEWRIAERHIVIDRVRVDPVADVQQPVVAPEWEGKTGPEDPSYAHFAAATTSRR